MSEFYKRLDKEFSVIAGPCLIESTDHAVNIAGQLKSICDKLNINFIYKSSFDKANRTSINSQRGKEIELAMNTIDYVKDQVGCEFLTDVHEDWHCEVVGADILQIPAFLCRQTNLLKAAAYTNKPINVKKGQFLAPEDTRFIIEKLETFGHKKHMLTERGTTFGYHNLVVDFRSLNIMKEYSKVIFDATHSVQSPGGLNGKSGGDRHFAPLLAYAATAVGVNGIFMEVHDDPDNAPSDGPNMIKLSDFENVLENIINYNEVTKNRKEF